MGIMVYSLKWVMQDFVHQPKNLQVVKPCHAKRIDSSLLEVPADAQVVGVPALSSADGLIQGP